MAVEAARAALRAAPGAGPAALLLRDRRPRLPRQDQRDGASTPRSTCAASAAAVDMVGLGALRRRARCARRSTRGRPTLAVLSDVRTGLPGGADEREGGDAAVGVPLRRRSPSAGARRARRVGVRHRGVPRPVARARASAASRQWEERFGEHVYVPARRGRARRGAQAGGRHRRRARPPRRGRPARPRGQARGGGRVGAAPEALADDLARHGRQHRAPRTPGSCSPTRSIARSPDQLIARGARSPTAPTSSILRTTDALARTARRRPTVAEPVRRAARRVATPTFLTWRGFLAAASRRAAPIPSARRRRRRSAPRRGSSRFTGSRCQACGDAAPAAAARVREVPRGRPHGARAHGRRARDRDRDLHGRPPRVLALAARGGGGGRLRGRRPLPVRADRRRSRRR